MLPPAPQRTEPLDYGALNLSTPGAVSPATSAKSQFVKNLSQKSATPAPIVAPTAPPTSATPVNQFNYNNGVVTPSTPPPPGTANGYIAPGANTPPSAADSAFSAYMQSLTSSPDTTAANDYLNKLITQSAQDQEKALSSGETMGFATGEAARVGRQDSLAIDAASRAVGALSSRDQNRTTASKARLDYEQGKIDDAAKASSASKPSIVQEFEYAKKNGYTGSFTQYQNEDANRKNPAQSTAKPTAAETQANGFSVINQLLVPGMKIKGTAGIPYLDNEGYLTPEGLDKLIAAAESDGISRKTFLDEFGVFIGATNGFKNYNLTAAEKKRLLGV